MDRDSAAIVAAVRACVGTRFVAQGRLPGVALDCVGVALTAAAANGVAIDVPPYSLAGDHEGRLDAFILAAGFVPVTTATSGDLLVVAPGANRRHLAVVTGRGVVHAHAGLRRVVEGPVDPTWAIVGAFRFPRGA